MFAYKVKDVDINEIIFLKNYDINKLTSQNKSINYAWKKVMEIPFGKDKGKILIARWKNCAQRLLDPDHIIYTITE